MLQLAPNCRKTRQEPDFCQIQTEEKTSKLAQNCQKKTTSTSISSKFNK